MFKLESYISPWLMGYLDRYVKLRPEDLQLSLWGGDAVLYNLDLRLDVLEKAMQLPITFKSGHIHELRLHVPWTKLGSEPILITINTVECILKVRDTAYDDASSSASSSSVTAASKARRKIKRQAAEELPPGYLQSILNRIVNNVTFIINNLILKFVEDDIVLSVNVKSAECYSCDIDWKRAFVDISPPDLVLRKVINFSDLTVCLDKSSADGHIENYQEPMLYRCFIMCRLHLTYDSVNAKMPSVTKLNVFCEKLDWLITDTQLPMFIRLIELCLALYYGYLDFPASTETDEGPKLSVADKYADSSVDGEERLEGVPSPEEQGWAAWMWSMVPQILPDEEDEEHNMPGSLPRLPVLSLGFYIQQAAVTFKLTEQVRETSSKSGGRKLLFHPFLVLDMRGIAVEMLMQGFTFFAVQCGISSFTLTPHGPCICGHRDTRHTSQSSAILSGGKSTSADLSYDAGSLFDPQSSENRGEAAQFVVTSEDHVQKYTESYGLQRFGSFWMDYLSTLVLPDSGHSSSQSSDTDVGENTLFQQENTTCRFLFGPSHIHISSSAVHRIHKFLSCAWNHHYEPYNSTKQPSEERGERVQLTETQVKELEEFIPTCSHHLTLLQPSITVSAAHHPHCDIAAKVYLMHRAKGKRTHEGSAAAQDMADICLSAERFDLQILKPTYPGRLARLVSHIVGPSSNLLHHCHAHTQIKVFSLKGGLRPGAQRERTCPPVVILPPCSMAAYFRSLVLPHVWKNSYLPLWERSYELVQGSVMVSKASLLAVFRLVSSWIQPSSHAPHADDTLLSDLFPETDGKPGDLPVLEVSVSGVELRSCHTPLLQAYTGSLSSLQALLYIPDTKGMNSVPLLYGPVDSSLVADRVRFQHTPAECLVNTVECVAFTLQKPHHTSTAEAPSVFLVSIEGVAGCLDPGLLRWFAYAPRSKHSHSPLVDVSSAAVDVPLAEATSPLQVTGSHMSIRSGSSHTQPTSSRLYSHSQTLSRPLTHSGGGDGGSSKGGQDGGTADSLSSFLVQIFPLLRMMQVQVDVKSSCVFLPSAPLLLSEGSADIAANIQTLWWGGVMGEVLVVCLPSVSVHSAASSPMAILQDIPITLVDGSLLSEKLPWTVQVRQITAYTLHKDKQVWPLLEGLSVTSTVGATVHYNPPTSDNIQAIALCIHLDITPPQLALTQAQVSLAWRLADVIGETVRCGMQLGHTCYTLCVRQHLSATDSGDKHHSDHDSSGMRHTEVLATFGSPDLNDVGTTDVSEDTGQEPLHPVDSATSPTDTHHVKLSVWLQCVLPRFTLSLIPTAHHERRIKIVMEDLAVSCDVQQVYLKLKSRLGSISINNYTRSGGGEWQLDGEVPVIMSTLKELPHGLHVVSNQNWSVERNPSRHGFPLQDSFSREKAHGFFSLTYTQALCKNVRKKMRKMNVELTSMVDQEERQPTHGLFFHKLVSELCIKMEPLDIVVHFATVERVLSLVTQGGSGGGLGGVGSTVDRRRDQSVTVDGPRDVDSPSVFTATHTTPLIYADIGTIRVFVPLARPHPPQPQAEEPAIRSTLVHDMVLLQMDSFHLQPYADNPLPRYPVERDMFLQALQAEMLHQTGSCIEDRQYQLQVKGMAVSSGQWEAIVQAWKQKQQKEGGKAPVGPGAQNPALEWNTYLGQGPQVQEIQLIPMAAAFDMCVVVAPPVVYHNVLEAQCKLVCGLTAELNILSDLDLHLSAQQLCLLSALMTRGIALTGTLTSPPITSTSPAASHANTTCDSGVESERSSATRQDGYGGHRGMRRGRVPVDVLLTAGRIALTLYAHTDQAVSSESPDQHTTPDQHATPDQHTTPDRPKRQKDSSKPASRAYTRDNFFQMTKGMCGVQAGDADGQCVPFSFIQPLSDDASPQSAPASGVFVQPFVYVYIAQPHTVVSCWPHKDKVELSCYDILVRGTKTTQTFPVAENRLMPDHADFDIYWVETRAGQPHPKTGIPPSLLTLHIANLMSLPAAVEVRVERPVKVNLGRNTLQQLSHFTQHLAPDGHAHSPLLVTETADSPQLSSAGAQQWQTGDTKHSQLAAVSLGVAEVLEKVALHTEQVVVSYEAVGAQSTAGLLASAGNIILDIQVQQKPAGGGMMAQGGVTWKDIIIKTLYNKNQHVVVGPVTAEVDAVLRWPGRAPVSVPQLVLSVQAGLVLVRLGQETALCLHTIVDSFLCGEETVSPASSELGGCTGGSTSSPRHSPSKASSARSGSTSSQGLSAITVHSQSHDDLRAGPFTYIQSDGSKEWPDAWEILFSQGDPELGIDSIMTWAYPEPRLITSVTALPVPFTSCLVQNADQHVTVPCQLQYWDERVQAFVAYTQFELSESESRSVKLPEVKAANVGQLAVAYMWRLVLCHNQTSGQGESSMDSRVQTQSAGREQSLVLATSLAASVCVDSCYAPSLIPALQVSLSLACLQLHLYNHLTYNGTGVPRKLRGYKMSACVPVDQQWGVVSIGSLVLLASHVASIHSRTAVEMTGQAQMEVLDYGSLGLLPVVDPVDIQVNVNTLQHQQPCAVEAQMRTSRLHAHLGASVMHTINACLMAWATFTANNESDALVFSHLIVCNNTLETLRFGQVGTDENIAVQAGHMLPYSWRSYQNKQHLHLCLDQPTWRWCSPISLEKDGHTVRVVRARDQRYTIVIRTRHLTPVCRQVTVSGQLVLGSRLSVPLEVRLVHHHDDTAKERDVCVLEPGQMLPSFVAEHDDVVGISLRLVGQSLPWSHTVHVGGDDMRDNQLLKLMLPDGVSFFHVWCRIFCRAYGDARQKVILLSPLYVLRSHLPRTLFVSMETGRSRQRQELEVIGQGYEFQLHCTGGDVSHHISFRLGMDLPRSSPPVTLSSGLVDQVRQAEEASIDVDALCDGADVNDAALTWPYTNLPAASDVESWSGLDQTSVDLNIHLTQYLAGCRTLLVDITPWCLLTNTTPLSLVLLTHNRDLAVPSGATIAPPTLQAVQLGLKHGGELCQTSPIPLSEDEVEQHRYSPQLGSVLFLDGCVHAQLTLLSDTPGGLTQVVPLTVTSTMVRGMRVITVSTRLLMTNATGLHLHARLMAIPLISTKLAAGQFHICHNDLVASTSTTAVPALHWQLLHDGGSDNAISDLALYVAFRLERNPATAHDEGSSVSPEWTVPVRVHHSPDGARLTVAVPTNKDGQDCSVALCVTCQVHGAQTYIALSQDKAPSCVLHNYCPFPISFGQAVSSLTALGQVVQEESELLDAVPVLQSGGWVHYTMPHINTQFPALDTSLPRLHIRTLLPAQDACTGQADLTHTRQASQGMVDGVQKTRTLTHLTPSAWSAGIDLSMADTFLQIAQVGNIKVNVKLVSSVRHIIFSVLNKAEVSAKEIRSRIRGSEDVTVTTASSEGDKAAPADGVPDRSPASVHSLLQELESVGRPMFGQVTVGVLLDGLRFTLHDDLTQPAVITELLQLHLDRVLLTCYPAGGEGSMCVGVCVGDMQVDNPLTPRGRFDFPVVLRPQEPVSPVSGETVSGLGVVELHAVLRSASVVHMQLVMGSQPQYGVGLFFDSLDITVKPLSLYVEDCYFYRLTEEFVRCLPNSLSLPSPHLGLTRRMVPPQVLECARLHRHPLRISRLSVQPASVLLSVHASIKLFLATDQAPLAFRRFERQHLFTCTQQLVYTMAMHYITAAVFRAGAVVGAMEILGSPTGLVRSVGVGMSDLVLLPYRGLTNSPSAFVGGIFGGVRSFVRNTTAGMVTSVTNFASSLSRNMDQLSFDVDHRERQDESRRQRPTGLSSGLHQGLTGFGLCLLGAVAGLVDQPLQTVVSQQSGVGSNPKSAASTAGNLLAGVGKGLVGVITKPIAGAAQLVSQTGQGLLQGTGLRQQMEPRCPPSEILRATVGAGWLKYPLKLLPDTWLLLAVMATQEDLLGEEAGVVLLLTRDMVVVVSVEDDAQQQAFALSQLQCSRPAPAIIQLQVADTTATQDHANKERVAAFVNSSPACNVGSVAMVDRPPSLSGDVRSCPSPHPSAQDVQPSVEHLSDEDPDGHTQSHATASHSSGRAQTAACQPPACHEFRMEPHWCQLFAAMFTLAQNSQKGRGFVHIV